MCLWRKFRRKSDANQVDRPVNVVMLPRLCNLFGILLDQLVGGLSQLFR
jgi:hypothetical protein